MLSCSLISVKYELHCRACRPKQCSLDALDRLRVHLNIILSSSASSGREKVSRWMPAEWGERGACRLPMLWRPGGVTPGNLLIIFRVKSSASWVMKVGAGSCSFLTNSCKFPTEELPIISSRWEVSVPPATTPQNLVQFDDIKSSKVGRFFVQV